MKGLSYSEQIHSTQFVLRVLLCRKYRPPRFENKNVLGISGGDRGAEHSLRMYLSSLHLVSSRKIGWKEVFYLFDIRIEQRDFARWNLGLWEWEKSEGKKRKQGQNN